ncbi:hypothetical protein [Alteromonas sp. H39]|uniref:hypothetical protein n=1 Tax=Alteromonas sp. H39 TaxID=3389876 RepID=UPI0039E0920D
MRHDRPKRLRPSLLKGVVTLLLVVSLIAYPVVVYLHIDKIAPGWYAGILLLLVVLRVVASGNINGYKEWLLPGVVSVFCLLVMLYDSVIMLKFYPVLMNVGMGLMFLVSLTDSQTLIEKFAIAGGKKPPQAAAGYLRTLTLCWGLLLLFNGIIAAYTAWFSSTATWALYNGLISYVLIGSFALIEFGYRGFYKKKHNIVDDEN